jgi:hypothetical protein
MLTPVMAVMFQEADQQARLLGSGQLLEPCYRAAGDY